MPETALMVPSDLSHNVPALIAAAKTPLTNLATLYLATEVAGQSPATFDAKRRDLHRFLAFYHQLYGHDRPDEWFVSVTKAFLKQVRGQGFAQASLVRIYATVRHFARWLHRKFPELFLQGCPIDGVKPPAEPTADWKGLTRREELRLLNAAQTLRVRPGSGITQGLRNHALLTALLGSGLRISEILQLDRDQYTGKGFAHVQVKGGSSAISSPCSATPAPCWANGWNSRVPPRPYIPNPQAPAAFPPRGRPYHSVHRRPSQHRPLTEGAHPGVAVRPTAYVSA